MTSGPKVAQCPRIDMSKRPPGRAGRDMRGILELIEVRRIRMCSMKTVTTNNFDQRASKRSMYAQKKPRPTAREGTSIVDIATTKRSVLFISARIPPPDVRGAPPRFPHKCCATHSLSFSLTPTTLIRPLRGSNIIGGDLGSQIRTIWFKDPRELDIHNTVDAGAKCSCLAR